MMRQILVIIASVAIVILSASSMNNNHQQAALYKEAPSVMIKSDNDVISFDNNKGKWVILSFWSSYDAESRMAMKEASQFLNILGDKAQGEVEIISVNFDRSKRLMDEIIRFDKLVPTLQFHINDAADEANIRYNYKMNSGLRTFIINPDGFIIAADPTKDTFQKMIADVI